MVLQNVGSAVAHTDLTFGDGSLWLYGYATGTPEVVRISPVSGAVEGTIVNAPPIGGLYPAVAADAAGAWLGGGPGGTAQLDWVPANTTTARATSYAAPTANSAILWLAAHGGRVWAGVATYTQGARTTSVTTRLVALSDDGNVAVRSGSEPVGLFPAVATPDGRLWGVQYARKCGGRRGTARDRPDHRHVTRRRARWPRRPNACDNEDGGSELAVDRAGRLRAAHRGGPARPSSTGRHDLTADRPGQRVEQLADVVGDDQTLDVTRLDEPLRHRVPDEAQQVVEEAVDVQDRRTACRGGRAGPR